MARVLLIDDDDDLRALLREQLLTLGHSVGEAANGRIGLERFHELRPDLVITDINMPVMEGLETITRLKTASPTLKIIAMSGSGRNSATPFLRMAEKLGAGQILEKPFSLDALAAAVTKSLGEAEAPESPRTFLVLDDDATSRALNRCMLKTEFPDCAVIECGSIPEALDASANIAVDAVITDHHLGQSDGAEFLARLRQQGVDCPVIMVTGSSDPKAYERAYRAGASRVFFGSDLDFPEYLRQMLAKG